MPVSYWRFESSDDLGKDSAKPGESLRPRGSSAWHAKPFGSGGIVGALCQQRQSLRWVDGSSLRRGRRRGAVELLKTGPCASAEAPVCLVH